MRKFREGEKTMKQFPHPAREEITLAGVLHALSDPVRLSVVYNLMGQEAELPCGRFEVPVHKSTMSHHLRVLREAGIVRMRPEGTQNLLSLRCEELESLFPGLLESILQAARACAARQLAESEEAAESGYAHGREEAS
jgi:DNA-binding transcriptional ArsR family regulator